MDLVGAQRAGDERGEMGHVAKRQHRWCAGHVELVAQLQPVMEATTAATQLALFRICQESLTNVLRHSQTRSATVRLELDDGYAVLTVTDEGSTEPLDPAIVPGGGLLGMRERAELLGGSLRVERPSPGGFLVEARLPVRRMR